MLLALRFLTLVFYKNYGFYNLLAFLKAMSLTSERLKELTKKKLELIREIDRTSPMRG
jgi:hypothetical protein